MNLYSEPELKIGDTEESYVFIKTARETITVQFTKWNADIILEAKFTIQKSDTYRKLHSTYICTKGLDGENEIRLSLHSLYSSSKTKRTQVLPVDKLSIKSGEKIRFCYIKYYADEQYDQKYSCTPLGGLPVPDVIKGGVVIRP
ncbi:hypothetical protein [uncultured Winogradskyella sp.]|uniref:hypothetical protein n=1 Tax=uncultured Winogradskyella sp. TaxID=395353 RepID=UPI0026301C22|nr:hypothetical protein [uncultured Winogradskyella sp.]